MPYFVAILCSPVALLMVQRPLAAALNAILYAVAWVLLEHLRQRFSVLPGVMVWAIAFWHAYSVIKPTRRRDRNDRLQRWDYFKFC